MSAEAIRSAAGHRWRTHKLRGRSWGYHLQRVPLRRSRPGWLRALKARKDPPLWAQLSKELAEATRSVGEALAATETALNVELPHKPGCTFVTDTGQVSAEDKAKLMRDVCPGCGNEILTDKGSA